MSGKQNSSETSASNRCKLFKSPPTSIKSQMYSCRYIDILKNYSDRVGKFPQGAPASE